MGKIDKKTNLFDYWACQCLRSDDTNASLLCSRGKYVEERVKLRSEFTIKSEKML